MTGELQHIRQLATTTAIFWNSTDDAQRRLRMVDTQPVQLIVFRDVRKRITNRKSIVTSRRNVWLTSERPKQKKSLPSLRDTEVVRIDNIFN